MNESREILEMETPSTPYPVCPLTHPPHFMQGLSLCGRAKRMTTNGCGAFRAGPMVPSCRVWAPPPLAARPLAHSHRFWLSVFSFFTELPGPGQASFIFGTGCKRPVNELSALLHNHHNANC